MLDLVNLSIQFGGKSLFEHAQLRINKGDRIALVGPNGAGKTTLLRLIAGTEQPEEGQVLMQKGLSLGYLPQEFTSNSKSFLYDEVRNSLPDLLALDSERESVQDLMSKPGLTEQEHQDLAERLGEISRKEEETDYYSAESRIKKVLSGLGFSEDDFFRSVSEFSGGWKMRIELAKILLSKNDLIMLDEPTNHLDMDSLSWLINYLKSLRSALLIVSHDRFFINQVTVKTLEIFNRTLNFFPGNYDSYLIFKEKRAAELEAKYELQQKKIKETEKFIERFRYKATKAKQVQSRIKQLEKTEIIEVESKSSGIKFRFPEAPRCGAIPIEAVSLSKGFGEKNVLQDVSFRLERGDKVALVGPNGAGKTTLARLLAGEIKEDSGEIITGFNTIISYYNQSVAEALDKDKDLLETLADSAEESDALKLRSLLGCFLFSDDDVFKKVGVLSGGEKSRLALARILLQKSNLLILDEPTNHLDFSSKDVLSLALKEYGGSLIVVSHDIDFLRPFINRVVEIRPGSFKQYYGGINYFLEKKLSQQVLEQGEPESKKNFTRKDKKKLEAAKRQEKFKATKDLRIELDRLEEKVSRLEQTKAALEAELLNPEIYKQADTARSLNAKYEESNRELDSCYAAWTELSEKLETIETEFD